MHANVFTSLSYHRTTFVLFFFCLILCCLENLKVVPSSEQKFFFFFWGGGDVRGLSDLNPNSLLRKFRLTFFAFYFLV